MRGRIELVAMLVCGLGLMSTARAQVSLPPAAEIGETVIHLSDLLPSSAGADLRRAGRAVILGFSPVPGSPRALSGEEIRRRIPAGLRPQIAIPEQVLVVRRGWPIEAGAIRSAIAEWIASHGGDEPDLDRLHWPAILATQPKALLQAVAAGWDPPRQELEFRLRCADALACRPCLADAPAESRRPSPQLWTVPGPKPMPLVRAGERAVVSVREGEIAASRQVICLESGNLRESIRVKDTQRVEVFRARIVGPGRLTMPSDAGL